MWVLSKEFEKENASTQNESIIIALNEDLGYSENKS